MGSRSPHGKRQFWGGKGLPIVKYKDTAAVYAKNGWSDRVAIWIEVFGGPREPCIRWWRLVVQIPPCEPSEWAFLEEKRAHVQGLSAMSCARTAEAIYLPFGLWTQVHWMQHQMQFNRICQVAPMCPHGKACWRHVANMIEPSSLQRRCSLMSYYFDHLLYYGSIVCATVMCFVAVLLMRFFAALIIWLIVVLSAAGSSGFALFYLFLILTTSCILVSQLAVVVQ